jgi:hypothetical protein
LVVALVVLFEEGVVVVAVVVLVEVDGDSTNFGELEAVVVVVVVVAEAVEVEDELSDLRKEEATGSCWVGEDFVETEVLVEF